MSGKKAALHACGKLLLPCCLLAFHSTGVLAQTEAFKECVLES